MRTAIGMITKRLDSSNTLLKFLENAEKYGHKIDSAIVTYSNGIDARFAAAVNEKTSLSAIDIYRPEFSIEQFKHRGISRSAADTLLVCPFPGGDGLAPYGFNRNLVLIEAILKNIDLLFFVDSDVCPSVLVKEGGAFVLKETDFFGSHLKHLNAGAKVTTSEYSGYSILPPARFDGMDDLLLGLQKDSMLQFWKSSASHKCLVEQRQKDNCPSATKILGGNVGLDLHAFSVLPPFFSSYYEADGEYYLSRGEDTVLSLVMGRNGISCTDVQTDIFHNTYGNYPATPDLKNDAATQKRFFYACTGWIGRNPFYNYVLGNDLREAREYQRQHLAVGAPALSGYTSNPCFKTLLHTFDASWNNLPRYIVEYKRLLESWSEFINKTDLSLYSA